MRERKVNCESREYTINNGGEAEGHQKFGKNLNLNIM